MTLLRIYIPAHWHDASICQWSMGDESGQVFQSGESTPGNLPLADAYLAIIAAERVTCISVPAPNKARRRWEAALPFIAEEFCLTEPELNHVVPGPAKSGGTRQLLVIDKAWLKTIATTFELAKRPLNRVIPETLLPQCSPNSWTIIWNGRSGFVRTGELSGFALDLGGPQQPPLALKLSLNETHPRDIEIRYPADVESPEPPQWKELPGNYHLGPQWDWRRSPIPEKSINLLWGDFAPRHRLQKWLPKLLPPLYILCAALALEAIAANIEWWHLASEKRLLSRQMERSFHQAFGEDSVAVNPVVQMARKLADLHHAAGLTDESDFLSLVDTSAAAFTSLPPGSIRGLRYETGRLEIDVNLPSAEDARTLQHRLQSIGFFAKLGEMHAGSSGIEARVSLQIGDIP